MLSQREDISDDLIQLVRIAARNGDINYLKTLDKEILRYCINLPTHDSSQWTAIYYAVSHNRFEMVEFLIESGADISYEVGEKVKQSILDHSIRCGENNNKISHYLLCFMMTKDNKFVQNKLPSTLIKALKNTSSTRDIQIIESLIRELPSSDLQLYLPYAIYIPDNMKIILAFAKKSENSLQLFNTESAENKLTVPLEHAFTDKQNQKNIKLLIALGAKVDYLLIELIILRSGIERLEFEDAYKNSLFLLHLGKYSLAQISMQDYIELVENNLLDKSKTFLLGDNIIAIYNKQNNQFEMIEVPLDIINLQNALQDAKEIKESTERDQKLNDISALLRTLILFRSNNKFDFTKIPLDMVNKMINGFNLSNLNGAVITKNQILAIPSPSLINITINVETLKKSGFNIEKGMGERYDDEVAEFKTKIVNGYHNYIKTEARFDKLLNKLYSLAISEDNIIKLNRHGFGFGETNSYKEIMIHGQDCLVQLSRLKGFKLHINDLEKLEKVFTSNYLGSDETLEKFFGKAWKMYKENEPIYAIKNGVSLARVGMLKVKPIDPNLDEYNEEINTHGIHNNL